jgi:hypothetical protein
MSIKATAVIKKERKTDPRRPRNTDYYASLVLLNEQEKPYGLPRYLSGFPEVGDRLKREAGVTHEQLQDRLPRYDRREEVRISLTLENEEAIKNLGFDPKST